MKTYRLYSYSGEQINIGGVYKSTRPINAAKKAFNSICRKKKLKNNCIIKQIFIKEITRGSKGKIYKYELKRIVLKEPLKIKRGNKVITIKYDTKVRKKFDDLEEEIKKLEEEINKQEKNKQKQKLKLLEQEIQKQELDIQLQEQDINEQVEKIKKQKKQIKNFI